MDLTCSGCRQPFDTTERVPLALSCGCDLCSFCCEERKGQSRTCPECEGAVDYSHPPTNRRLYKMVQANADSCLVHPGRPFDFWCSSCAKALCGLCAVAHKESCVRQQGTFYLMMTNIVAAEDVVRNANEHVKSIDATCNELENSVPPSLCKTREEFAEFLRGKALEAVESFYRSLGRTMGDLLERFDKERAAAAKEEEKRDTAVVALAGFKGALEMGVMELSMAMKEAKEAAKADAEAIKNLHSNASATAEEKAELEAHQRQQAKTRDAEIGRKASAVASSMAKLDREAREGVLRGSINCHHIRHLEEVKVLSLEMLHPTWSMADPPPKTCALFRGVQRSPLYGAGGAGGASAGVSAARGSNQSPSRHSGFYEAGGQVLRNDGGSATGLSSSSAATSLTRSSVTSGGGAGPRQYDVRDVSPPSDRRPRLMESLWREQVRSEESPSRRGYGGGAPAAAAASASASSSQYSNSRMMSPGGASYRDSSRSRQQYF